MRIGKYAELPMLKRVEVREGVFMWRALPFKTRRFTLSSHDETLAWYKAHEWCLERNKDVAASSLAER